MQIEAISQRTARDGGTASIRRLPVGGARVGLLRRHLWKGVLAAGCLLVMAYYIAPEPVAADVIYAGIGLGSAGTIVLGMRRYRAVCPTGWYLIAAGSACFVAGDLILDFYELVLHIEAPVPSFADLVYLSGYPLMFAGVRRLSRTPGRGWSGWIDATAICAGTLGLLWHYLMGPTIMAPGPPAGPGLLDKLVLVSYPVMDLGVLWVIAASVLWGAARRTSDRLMMCAVGCMLVGDFGYDLQMLHGDYRPGSWVNGFFLLAYVLMAVAAVHPSVADAHVASGQGAWQSPASVVPVAVTALISPVIMLVCGLGGLPSDLPVLATTSVVVFGLVLLRIWRLLVEIGSQNDQLAEKSRSLHSALAIQELLQHDLRHQSLHDDLTGLANRSLLQESVAQALATCSSGSRVALCLCDLDDFKAVNDSLGHQVGDQLLAVVGKRLASIVRGGAVVARLGGDEFAVLLENAEQPESATALAERIVLVLRQPIHLPEHHITVTASVGIAIAAPAATAATLLSEADAAMYEAKAAGKNRVALFETSMRSRLLEKTSILNCFPGALQRGEFVLEYQPQFGLPGGRLEGFEALVRWRHPGLGLIGPATFIPLAEETRFILPLGRWVLRAACREAATWPSRAGLPLSLAVNVSGRQVQDPAFLDTVREALQDSGLPPASLVLEITESVVMDDPAGIAEVLRTVRRLGVRVAIDDFGTGFSSLSQLRQLPADILKIDKSFIDPLNDPRNEGDAFVATIVRLADDLGLDTVAEGIENPVQLEALIRLGCQSGQGYLVAASLSAAATRHFIGEGAIGSVIPELVSGTLVA